MTFEYTQELVADLRHALVEVVRGLSDPTYQQEVWVEASRPGVMDSAEEAACTLFDDCEVEQLVEGRLWGGRLTPAQREALRNLAARFDAFLEPLDDVLDSRAVITHVDWPEVVQAAQRALEALEEDM